MTMVKARTTDEADRYLEHLQEKHDMNKMEAASYVLNTQARDWNKHEANQ